MSTLRDMTVAAGLRPAIAGKNQSETGSATVPVALFGVSPNS